MSQTQAPAAALPGAATEEFHAAVQELARQAGLADMPLDEDGVCTFTLDGSITLHLAPGRAAGALNLFALLPELPAELPAAQLAQLRWRMLAAGYLPDGDPVAVALHPRLGRPVLVAHRPHAAAGSLGLLQWVEAFADLSAAWREVLAAQQAGASPVPTDEPPAGTWLRV